MFLQNGVILSRPECVNNIMISDMKRVTHDLNYIQLQQFIYESALNQGYGSVISHSQIYGMHKTIHVPGEDNQC